MKKYKILICIIICLMTMNDNFSQTPSDPPAPFDPLVFSQTPERGKFPVLMENFSVDHFTGQPNITIPIYTVDSYDIQVPIALKYRTGGLRVDVEDGYLGLNWDLIAGGEIRRTLVGMPDEMLGAVKGYNHLNELSIYAPDDDRKNFLETLLNYNYPFTEAGADANCHIIKLSKLYGDQYSNGRFDTGPDIYNFNIRGISGTFTTGIAGNVENLQTNEWVFVTKHGGDLHKSYFEIKDSKGYVYTFGEKEWHEYKYRIGFHGNVLDWSQQPIYKEEYVITWKLSEIKSPSGEIVAFFYDSHDIVDKQMEESLYKTQSSYSNNYHPTLCMSLVDNYLTTDFQRPLFSGYPAEDKEKYTYKYLTQIASTNTKVVFRYSGDENHIPQLSGIGIFVAGETFSINIKSFTINNAKNYNLFYSNIHSIQEYGAEGAFKEYKFSYYPSPGFQRFSVVNKDHWGYYSPGAKEFASGIYNFNTNSAELVGSHPKLVFKENPNNFGHRNPRMEGANDGMLRRITYPTGGSVTFDWEFHDYSKKSALLEQSDMTDGYFQDHEITHQTIPSMYHELKEEINRSRLSTDINVVNNSQEVFIDLENYYPRPGGIVLDCYENDQKVYGITLCNCVYLWESNGIANGSLLHPDIPYLKITGPNYSEIIEITRKTVWEKHKRKFNNPGNYKFELFNAGKELLCHPEFAQNIMDPAGNYGKVGISLSYWTNPQEYNESKKDSSYFAGGVRIKEMTFESDNNRIRKLYNYALNPYHVKSPSSGVLTKAPRYGSKSKISMATFLCPEGGPGHPGNELYYLTRFTLCSNALPKSTESSSHIEYARVTEFTTNRWEDVLNNKLDSLGNIRATIYDYVTSAVGYGIGDINETLNIQHAPNNQLILTSKHFNRGHLIQKKEYTNEERITKYRYDILEKTQGVNLIPGTFFTIRDFSAYSHTHLCDNIFYTRHKDFGIVRYRIIPYNKRVAEIEETGTLTDNYQKFTYANPGYSDYKWADLPTSATTVNSEGDTIVNYYSYTNLNRIHTCVTASDGKIVAAYRNEYDQFGNLTEKYIAEISPSDNLLAANYQVAANYQANTLQISEFHPIYLLTNKCIETRVYEKRTGYIGYTPPSPPYPYPYPSYPYEKTRLCQITDSTTNVSTVYIWGYEGEYPIAEIKNFTIAQRDLLLTNTQLNDLFKSKKPADIAVINNLRSQLPDSPITTLTYKMKRGVASVTDPRGVTTYYDYDEFGWLNECYIIENNQKKIVQKTEYRWATNP